MRLKITDTNFTTKQVWLFKLADENGNEFYIMDEPFYTNHSLKNPITKKELDYYDRGHWITAKIKQIEDKGIVIGE